ncbi:NERD domain-containing protein [Rheinheimera sp. D18]|uniref:nuclease-related domain-containing protein n=1 Tax=Rheinheimera sp. D18 TaxID=2545632 RepID=UPI001044F5C3|nr:nuclease-related domain-containing protein [Rheinheimera sp. D18]QBL10450.1 NERD domain-containing protein [Rheinheimera sp. D18]
MRYLLLALSLLIFVSPQVYSQQQYTEGACIMLQQQIDRFSHQKQNSNFVSATREYEKFCRKPVRYIPRQIKSSDDTAVAKDDSSKATEVASVSDIPEKSELNQPETSSLSQKDTATVATEVDKKPPDNTATVIPIAPAISSGPKVIDQVVLVEAVKAEPLVAVLPDSAVVHQEAEFSSDLLMPLLNNIPIIAALLFAVLLTVFLVTSWLGLNLPGFKGVFAEYKLNRLLRWRLSDEYQHFRKLKLFTASDEQVIVDHLVLCPYGIFVITVKGERGHISGTETQANWTRTYLGSTKHLMNPLHQNFKNVAAVKHFLHLKEVDGTKLVHSIAAFSRVAKFETAISANITYVDTVSNYIKQFSEPCLTNEQQNRFAALLSQASTDL